MLGLWYTLSRDLWLSGNIAEHINEVALRRSTFVLRLVTIGGYTVTISVFNQTT